MSELLDQIGERLSERRKQLRMSQDELAEKADVSAQTISAAELGKKALRSDNVIKICDALEVSTDYLLLGKVGGNDYAYLFEKISDLNSAQFHHLEDIIKSYIAAIAEDKA